VTLARWWWRRRARVPVALRALVAACLGTAALVLFAAAGARGQTEADGRALYGESCSSCHGEDLRGIRGRGPNLRGVGEAAADFYVRTGRMPLRDPDDQPVRTESPFTPEQQAALIAYVGSFGGPGIPSVDPARGDLPTGRRLFGEHCMGCHQVLGQGGITTRGIAPALRDASPVDVAEAVAVGPYVMPVFPQLTDADVNSLARYVEYTKDPQDIGGWAIGHVGPIPEGMVAWLLAGVALLLVIRIIGERTAE
jgi:ubiquinol-cytochrome c reductase cytochrome c subunit